MIVSLFDTETTGLTLPLSTPLVQQPHIIQWAVALVDTDTEEIIEECEMLVRPPIRIDPIIKKLTGISNEMLIEADPFPDNSEKLFDLLEQSSVVIAHNLAFDKSLLSFELERMGLSLSHIYWPRIEICTVQQFEPIYGKRMKLKDLHVDIVGEYEQTHTALDDSYMIHRIALKTGLYKMFNR